MARAVAKESLNALARATLAEVPLVFWQRVFPKDLIALCYHLVSDEELPHARLYQYKNARQFREDIRFARERAVTYAQVVAHRLGAEPLPHNAMIFTFDDGFAECYEVVRPILLAEGIDAVFFVTTAFLDEQSPFFECTLSLCLTAAIKLPPERLDRAVAAIRNSAKDLTDPNRARTGLRRLREARLPVDGDPARTELCLWILGLTESDGEELARTCELLEVDQRAYVSRRPIFLTSAQVTQLARDGFSIGAHGVTHRTLEGASVQELEREIIASCGIVKRLTGQERVPFAFPYSGVAIDRDAIEMILRRNPDINLIFDSGCLRRDPAFIINRVFADAPRPGLEPALATALSAAWSVPSAWFRCS